MTIFEDCLASALATVLDLEFEDDALSDAVAVQACMLAGIEPEDLPG